MFSFSSFEEWKGAAIISRLPPGEVSHVVRYLCRKHTIGSVNADASLVQQRPVGSYYKTRCLPWHLPSSSGGSSPCAPYCMWRWCWRRTRVLVEMLCVSRCRLAGFTTRSILQRAAMIPSSVLQLIPAVHTSMPRMASSLIKVACPKTSIWAHSNQWCGRELVVQKRGKSGRRSASSFGRRNGWYELYAKPQYQHERHCYFHLISSLMPRFHASCGCR